MNSHQGSTPHAQANLLSLLSRLKEQGLTIFFSSHHLIEIEKVCDSVAILHRGTLRAHGSLDELLGDGQRCSLTVRPKTQPLSTLPSGGLKAMTPGAAAIRLSTPYWHDPSPEAPISQHTCSLLWRS